MVFQPMADGEKSSATWFSPMGSPEPTRTLVAPRSDRPDLRWGPDGPLYILDDLHGRIWRVVYKGDPTTAQIAPAPGSAVATASVTSAQLPEGTPADAARGGDLRPPPRATGQQVALGDRIFHGEARNGTCSGCHGSDAGGTSVGPSLSNGIWVWDDGSLPARTKTITTGVAKAEELHRRHTVEGWRGSLGPGCRRRRRVCLGGRSRELRAYLYSVGLDAAIIRFVKKTIPEGSIK